MTNPSNHRPARLRCEYRSNPLGVEERSPRLGWVIEADGRGRSQSAYHIVAARSKEDLDAERGTLWDSGKVSSNRSVNVPYEGARLDSGTRCYWKVRVWDEHDNVSSFSESAFWEMGLLESSEWTGQWIGLGAGAMQAVDPPSEEDLAHMMMGLQPCPYLRKTFVLGGRVRRARLYTTARGVYEIYLNGVRVGDDVLSPGWTDYNKRIQYQSHDVTELLQQGDNVVGGILGDGWYAGFVGMDPKRKGAHYGSRTRLLAQLSVEYEDGTVQTIASDGSWSSSTGPLLFSDLLMGESYDARREMDGWSEPGFDDSGWRPVSMEDLGDVALVAQPDQPARVTQEVPAKSVNEPEHGTYVFDMGQNLVGWARLKVEGEPGTRVRMRFTETLEPNGTIYTTNLRSARQTDTYTLKGGGLEVYEPRFTFHGFRYVEVTGYPGEPPLDAIIACVVHSDTPAAGSFECSSPLVNKLQSNIVWGQRGNFLSIPTDCPQRDERLGWMGDAQIFVRTASCNMDVSAFFAKWMVDVEDAQSPEGAFPDIVPLLPEITLGELSNGAPAWGDAGIIVPWTIYRVYADTRIIERHYGAMSRWMDYLRRYNPDLLRTERLGNNYGDWLEPGVDSPGASKTPKDLLATAYWAYDARLMFEMARTIGRDGDAEEYAKLFEGIRDAFNRAYVSSEGRIEGDTQTCYVLALHMDLLPEDLRPAAARRLVEKIEEKDWHLSTGFVGVGYLCPVLTEAGYADVAYRLLENETFPSWGYTIRQGATTIWERWDGWTEEGGFQSPAMNSFNHYSLGSVGEWLYRYVAGIDLDPEKPGYGHFVIRPRSGGSLTHARAEYDSVRGRIISDWEIENGAFQLRITVPANTATTVFVPGDRDGISEGGNPAERAEGVEYLREENGAVVFGVGSGDYEFVSGGS